MIEELRTLGLIGGMTWHSTADYYRCINEAVAEQAGELHSAPILLHSVDFDRIDNLMREGQWSAIRGDIRHIAMGLADAGVHGVAMASNTIHKVADAVEAAIDQPLLHIVEPTADAIREAGVGKVALLGTATTMSEDFYKGRLKDKHKIDVDVPNEDEQAELNRIIFDELGVGEIKISSRDWILRLVKRMNEAGTEGVILGCTELGEIIKPEDTNVQLFDTAALHAASLADFILSK